MQMPAWQTWGEAANRALDEDARAVPDFDKLAKSLGAEMTPEEADLAQTRLSRIGKLAAKALGALAGCPQWDEKGPTGWRWQLVDAVTKQTRDPDIDVARWLGGHTPLGIDRPIVPRGVFQWTDITKAQEASAEYLAALNGQGHIDRNYTSFHEHEEESRGIGQVDPGWASGTARIMERGHIKMAGCQSHETGHSRQTKGGWITQDQIHCRYEALRDQWDGSPRGKDCPTPGVRPCPGRPGPN